MPVPVLWSELSQTAASNSPAGTEDRTTADDYFRQIFVYLRKLYDGETVGQIAFPATQNASSGANTLDDYEEGTFTPTDGSGAGLSLTASGRYVKVGKQVTFWIKCVTPATGGVAAASLAGLPFSAVNAESQAAFVGYSNTANLVAAMVRNNSAYLDLYVTRATQATNEQLKSATFYLSGTYEAAA